MLKLRSLLTLPYLLLYLAFGIAMHWIYYEYEQQSILHYEKKIAGQIGDRVEMYLDQYLSEPELVVETNSQLIQSGYLDLSNLGDLGRYFTAEIKTHPGLTYLSFGSADGDYVAVRYLSRSGRIQLITSYKRDGLIEKVYDINLANNMPVLIGEGQFFDARSSSWYQIAEQSGQRSWYPVYKYEFLNTFGMGVSEPIYDDNNHLLGVITADVALSRISDYLQYIPTEANELIFMVDQHGELMATSTSEPIFIREGDDLKRMMADQSEHPLIRSAGQLMLQKSKPLRKQLITVDGIKYWIDEIKYNHRGLEFSIVIMISEQELAGVMRRPAEKMAIAIAITVLIGAIIGGILARRVSNRIHQLELRVAERTVELEKANAVLQNLATIDPVTGIFNRRHFDETLHKEWNRAIRSQQPLSLLICDVDYFKRYNDSQGHQAGDEVLAQIAQILERHALRPADMAARYGGEEFVLILPNTDEKEAYELARTILDTVNTVKIPHEESKITDHVTVSIGGSTVIPAADMDCSELIQQADEQLYLAKAKGRNCVMMNGMTRQFGE